MIIDSTNGYLDEVKASKAAQAITGRNSLQSMLDYLDTYADHDKEGLSRCTIYKDFAPLSFGVAMEKKDVHGEWKHMWTGGLIFHGDHENYTVTLNPIDGWSVHT